MRSPEGGVKLEIHVLSHDSERMLGWTLAHYRGMGLGGPMEGCLEALIIVHDGGPKFTQKPICDFYDAEHQVWDTAGELNDELAMKLKNECWKNSNADWVIVVDADELIYFPKGAKATLEAYEKMRAAVIKPHGFEMFSEEWRDHGIPWDTVSGIDWRVSRYLTDWVKMGAPEDQWYSKPVLFSPKRIAESGLGIGAHESRPVLKDGRAVYVSRKWPKANPPTYLLHCHQLGPIEMVAERYDATRARLAQINEQRGWGNFKPGIVHAQEKRDLICPNLVQVIP